MAARRSTGDAGHPLRARVAWQGPCRHAFPMTVATAGKTASGTACRRSRETITGTQWSGPAFFGTKHQEARRMTKLRCAIYTRKSSEEGLDQDFNSLDAQHEACAAYIKSQASEGWKLCPRAIRRRRHFGRHARAARPSAAARRHRCRAHRHRRRLQGRPADPLAARLRQAGRSVRQGRHQLRLDHPVVQHHHQHGSADPEHAVVVRAVRARGHRRTHPRQDRAIESYAACGWAERRRSATGRTGAASPSSRNTPPSSATSSVVMPSSAMFGCLPRSWRSRHPLAGAQRDHGRAVRWPAV